MRRRAFLCGLVALAGARRADAADAGSDRWLHAVRQQTGDTEALERLGVWLQVRARRAPEGRQVKQVLGELLRSQEADGYLGVYPAADRLGRSDRAVDEYWGLAELGRGLLELAERKNATANTLAERLGALLITVPPDRLDRDPSQQHPGGTALLLFLTGMARRTDSPAYAAYLQTLPPRIGLPGQKSPFEPALPPVLRAWTPDHPRNARGVAALSGILALARYQGHDLMAKVVREHWSALRQTFLANATPELLARWLRLTDELSGVGDPAELRAERERIRALRVPEDSPYSDLIRALKSGPK